MYGQSYPDTWTVCATFCLRGLHGCNTLAATFPLTRRLLPDDLARGYIRDSLRAFTLQTPRLARTPFLVTFAPFPSERRTPHLPTIPGPDEFTHPASLPLAVAFLPLTTLPLPDTRPDIVHGRDAHHHTCTPVPLTAHRFCVERNLPKTQLDESLCRGGELCARFLEGQVPCRKIDIANPLRCYLRARRVTNGWASCRT